MENNGSSHDGLNKGEVEAGRARLKGRQLSLNHLKNRTSGLHREKSMELDEEKFESLRSPRGFMRQRKPLMPLVIQSRTAETEAFCSVDLDDREAQVNLDEEVDVEVFRKKVSMLPKARDEFSTLADEEEEAEVMDLDMKMKEPMFQPMFSRHFGVLSDPEFSMDCGHSGNLEKKVAGLEEQLGVLRKAVVDAGGAGGLEPKKLSPRESWKRRLVGDADPMAVREKNRKEMELLLKAINYIMRKMDSVERSCDNVE